MTAPNTTTATTSLLAGAHRDGLFVHPFSFRNKNRRLVADYRADPENEYRACYGPCVRSI